MVCAPSISAIEIDTVSSGFSLSGTQFEAVGHMYYEYDAINNNNIYSGSTDVTALSSPNGTITVKATTDILYKTSDMSSFMILFGTQSTNYYTTLGQTETTSSQQKTIERGTSIDYVKVNHQAWRLNEGIQLTTIAPSYYLQDAESPVFIMSIDYLPGIDF